MTRTRTVLLYAAVVLVIGAVWAALARPQAVEAPTLPAGRKLQCVSYTPFRDGQSPYALDAGLTIPRATIEDDLALLARTFECVRTYSVTGLEAVPAVADKLGLKVLLGAWVSADPLATQREIKGLIALARRHPSVVRAVVVGNEALLRKEVTGEQLAGYIGQVKQALPGVPVTYADVWEFWLKHPQVAPATDFITIHILPYWEDDPVPAAERPAVANNTFIWPVTGRIVSSFGERANGARNDGVNIAVPAGTPVKAADTGTVIYAGNELPGFGNLVLVKHSNGYVTAYAHNSKLLVRKGDKVSQGQAIAKAGRTGGVDVPQVHFEIRRGDKPVDPRRYIGNPDMNASL